MSTVLAHLQDLFIPEREPDRALFCTYGFDAQFFEAEILPSLFPARLKLDREAGSKNAYLHAADEALQGRTVAVFFDHLLADGPELPYLTAQVDVSPFAFHPKLILLDYGDRLRASISSANLTRPAWTTLLELFISEDLIPGTPHPWSETLQDFVSRLAAYAAAARRPEVLEIAERLAAVPSASHGPRLLSSWDGPLYPRFAKGLPAPSRIDVVTPFFEGEEGSGILEKLQGIGASTSGRLFVSAVAADRGLEIHGPQEKIDALLGDGRWSMHRVEEEWPGDEEGSPPRALHGKMLAFAAHGKARVMVGSANVTNAALLGAPPAGNVELVVVLEISSQRLAGLLPAASPLSRGDVDFEERGDPTGEDETAPPGAERWVEQAVLWSEPAEVELRLVKESPHLKVSYDGEPLGEAGGPKTRLPIRIAGPLWLEVQDDEGSGIVPLTIGDPAAFAPRGASIAVPLEEFCDLLAGSREPEMPSGEPLPRGTVGQGDETGLLSKRGAIPWRRMLAALDGIEASLRAEAPFPRGVRFILRNETRLRGLRDRISDEHKRGRLRDADLAYFLHELRRMLGAAHSQLADHDDSRRQLEAVRSEVSDQLGALTKRAGDELAAQLRILSTEELS